MKSNNDRDEIEKETLGWSQWQVYCVFGGGVILLVALIASEYFKNH